MRSFCHYRLAWALPGILVLACLAYEVIKIIVSEVYHQHANTYLDYWRDSYQSGKQGDKGEQVSNEQLERVQKSIERAMGFQQENPELNASASRMMTWQAYLSRYGDHEVRDRQLELLRKGIQQRPAWPSGWIDLAIAKSWYGELDQEYEQALINSMLLGPWEPKVMRGAAVQYFHYKEFHSSQLSVQLKNSLQRFASAYPDDYKRLAKKYQSELPVK